MTDFGQVSRGYVRGKLGQNPAPVADVSLPARDIGVGEQIGVTDVGPAKMSRRTAEQLGFTGDACDNCGSMKMQRTGHCNTCAECGTTTGCS